VSYTSRARSTGMPFAHSTAWRTSDNTVRPSLGNEDEADVVAAMLLTTSRIPPRNC
jgi:hypothetical protein